jgi:uncharacterized protein
MIEYKKPLPSPDGDAKEFWDGTKKHELLVQKCSQCDSYRYPPSPICPKCFFPNFKWEKVSGKGEVYSFTIVRVAVRSEWTSDVPYVLATIRLDEGVRMVSDIIDCAVDDVKIGMRVQVAFDDVTEQFTLPKFKPI